MKRPTRAEVDAVAQYSRDDIFMLIEHWLDVHRGRDADKLLDRISQIPPHSAGPQHERMVTRADGSSWIGVGLTRRSTS